MTDPNPTLKISQLAREANTKAWEDAQHNDGCQLDEIIQKAINEACKPLVDALKWYGEMRHRPEDWLNDNGDIAAEALAAHKREHGREGKS